MLSLFQKDDLESNIIFQRVVRMALANKVASVFMDENESAASKQLALQVRQNIDSLTYVRLLIAAKAEVVFGNLSSGEIAEALQLGDSLDDEINSTIDMYWDVLATALNSNA